jgi:uncharacterized protein
MRNAVRRPLQQWCIRAFRMPLAPGKPPKGRAVKVALTLVVMAACLALALLKLAADRAMVLPVDPTPLVAITGGGAKSFTVEIARDAREREAGLMFRKTMADDHGMLFLFDRSRPLRFWMHNTIMPLDLVFIDASGRIRSIREGTPESDAIIASDGPARYVLELKAGTAARDGIRAGDLVEHPLVSRRRWAEPPLARLGTSPMAPCPGRCAGPDTSALRPSSEARAHAGAG